MCNYKLYYIVAIVILSSCGNAKLIEYTYKFERDPFIDTLAKNIDIYLDIRSTLKRNLTTQNQIMTTPLYNIIYSYF